ncbi:hypothetical protein GGS26DRAFT_297812 [Hypomontagnella submonticulosa]|nr:hypothetical protein GGS26DRAFT_297812 [Hypomontagnella submonticulosa]
MSPTAPDNDPPDDDPQPVATTTLPEPPPYTPDDWPEMGDTDDDSDDGGPVNRNLQLHELITLIGTRIEDSLQAAQSTESDTSCDTREQHNAHWRAVWESIREEANADENIPTALFSPPQSSIRVLVSKWPVPDDCCCCCDINEAQCPAISIRAPHGSEEGVTKDMFIQKVSQAMYGRAPGADGDGYGGYWIGREEDRPVLDHFNWMISPGGRLTGTGIFAFVTGLSTSQNDSDVGSQYESS